MREELHHERLTGGVIRTFYDVYNALGYGFLEYVYVLALERELARRGYRVAREVGVPVMYQGEPLAMQRIDMLVDDVLVVETKASEVLPPAARRQLVNYLKATHLTVGLLLHFGPEPRVLRAVHTRTGARWRRE